jgi:hypothetical protein
MRLLCLAASSRVYGQVLVAGKPPSVAEIARIVGARADQVGRLIDELESHQVFARSDLGVIQSRRMMADYEQSKMKTEIGRRGGNPALTRPNPPPSGNGLDNQVDKPLDNIEAEEESKAAYAHSEPPPRPPRQRGGRARAFENGGGRTSSRNAFVDMIAEEIDAETDDAHRRGAEVVPISRRIIGC